MKGEKIAILRDPFSAIFVFELKLIFRLRTGRVLPASRSPAGLVSAWKLIEKE